ncbi:MAG: long-chain fatty acid--CoA ligase [Myxococcales bacterium]|nr:long-chain fatty acid--CoA ligase [Myxococcales bacterium]
MTDKPWLKHYGPGIPHEVNPPQFTLDALFDQTVQRFPNRTAMALSVRAAGRLFTSQITFAELDALSDRFAVVLQQRGIAKGDRVALFMPNCPQFVIGYLGALKAGAIAVPVNPLYSAREAAYQLKDCGAKALLVLSRFYPLIHRIQAQTELEHVFVTNIKEHFPFTLRTLFTLTKEKKEGHRAVIDREMGAEWLTEALSAVPSGQKPVRHSIALDDLAVLLYSGGTTGISKGAMLTHRNLVTNAEQNRLWAITGDGCEVNLAALPLFHAFGLTCCLNLSLMTGSTLVLIPDPRDVLNVMMVIDRFKVTLFPAVPTLMVAISSHPRVSRYNLKSVRVCPCAGAAVAAQVHRDFLDKTGINGFEGYGLTECSPVIIGNPPHAENRIGTIGMPYPSSDARIVSLETGEVIDAFAESEEWTASGELEVTGPQLMQGYWNKPPEDSPIKDGWLQTGDIAQMHRDGYFRIVDRKKDMIIRGGMNIYPADIESVLYSHPKIHEALVIGVPDQARGELVKAFVTIKKGQMATSEEIRAYCKENLAKYKVPSFIEIRESLPRSAVGKLLRRALREEVHAQQAKSEASAVESSASAAAAS